MNTVYLCQIDKIYTFFNVWKVPHISKCAHEGAIKSTQLNFWLQFWTRNRPEFHNQMCFPSAEFNCFTAAHYRHIELWSSNPKLWSRSQRVESSKSLEQTLLLQSHSAWAQTLKQNSIKQTTLTELTFWWHKSYCFSPAFFSLFAGLFLGGFLPFFFLLLFVWGFFGGLLSPGSQNLVWTFIKAESKCLVHHKASEPGKFPRVCAFIPNIS